METYVIIGTPANETIVNCMYDSLCGFQKRSFVKPVQRHHYLPPTLPEVIHSFWLHLTTQSEENVYVLFGINGLILSRPTTGKRRLKNMCLCADKANSTRNLDRCA